jgi:molybdate transport system ATP-binding protein
MSAITLEQVTARIHDQLCLEDIKLSLCPEQNWAIVGPNGSGKSALGRLLCDQLEILSGAASLPKHSEYVSFERVTEILNLERYNDDSNSRGGADPGTLVRDFILAGQPEKSDQLEQLVEPFQLRPLLDRGLKYLSTGEMRKSLICRALCDEPELLVLDEPFDGLDQDSRQALQHLIEQLFTSDSRVLLLLNRLAELPAAISHIAYLENCRLALAGPRKEVLANTALSRLLRYRSELPKQLPEADHSCPTPFSPTDRPLVRMRNVRVSYNHQPVLNGLNWTVAPGEHWKVVGPNGSGKTTLLELISGDNPQAYANDIELFGRPKGSGESVWEIKRRIGLVSTALQRNYRVEGSCLAVIVSGFFDSIGVYQRPSKEQIEQARQWFVLLKLGKPPNSAFRELSFGEQRLVLLARAMVKHPQLLILDEPCQGLDELNRTMVLKLIDHIGTHWPTQLIYVTHQADDQVPCIHRQLELVPAPGGGCWEQITPCKLL